LNRPSQESIKRLEEELALALAADPRDAVKIEDIERRLARLKHLRKTVAYIDPLDLRYKRFEKVPRPTTQAVMFCLMDVSASMTEQLKDLAKRFFMLLHVFLTRHYREVDVVFIRHTTEAEEVDEQTFFQSTVTGGTVISSALEVMQKVIAERYPPADWNIYAAQASDGHNFTDDMARCIDMLENELVPLCQYFAYLEEQMPGQQLGGESVVWSSYQELAERCKDFAMRQVSHPAEIYPVFRDLFSGAQEAA
jgi:uncharacterized sporulation protein YeaH/YhbH (DUF444 family)